MDWARLDELRDEVGAEALDEIVEMFMAEIEDLATKLRTQPDMATLGADLHFLRGAALNLGFTPLAEACQTGELLARQGKADQVDLVGILARHDQCLQALADHQSAA
ncbi:Hpt domain-containing protein [Fluviibacterium sp. DFM31]|uniref:Hpt domain-containing protein n=1 Tax=Meridianimarinicoccus marinus TaxID=3231483 RepID=A0ABV3L8Y0_9RHOB